MSVMKQVVAARKALVNGRLSKRGGSRNLSGARREDMPRPFTRYDGAVSQEEERECLLSEIMAAQDAADDICKAFTGCDEAYTAFFMSSADCWIDWENTWCYDPCRGYVEESIQPEEDDDSFPNA